MDVLTDVMQTVRVRSHLYGRLELGAPWGMEFGACDRPGFFIVSRGNCWLEVTGIDGPVPLAGGDFVFLPKGRAHTLRDACDTPTVPIDEVFKDCPGSGQVLKHGGAGAPVSLVCGCFLFEDGGRNPLVESLPPMIHVRADGGPSVRWLETTLQFMATETASTLPGAETIASRLADILFVHAVRAHIAGDGLEVSGWLKALADPQIGEVLRRIHEAPHVQWTVESLAESVAMSRSAFAARFTALVGEPPLRYVTAWRMKKASHRLLQGDRIAAIAQATGYDTDAAFGKAFKRFMGATPGEYRRRARETELEPAH
ncbi:MAG TPA: AraC family transcriptional regulator [Planctomycetota bacterium]|jgi:AraC-like DNA-binding protein|nr:AraC family transcriptional regulator [Planctomycetota bacterium]